MTIKTPEQLNYSKPLDIHTWSDYPEVNDFVNSLWDEFLTGRFRDSVSEGKRPLSSIKKQFKDELNTVMNEAVNELLGGYRIKIKANKEIEDISSLTDKGIINVSKMKEQYLNRPKDLKRCEGYEARRDHHKEWLHTTNNPISFRIFAC